MRLESTFSQRHQMVECRCEASHRNVGHRRLCKASCVGGEMQACGFKLKRTVCSKPARKRWILLEQTGRYCRECNAAVTAQPLVAASDNRISLPTLCIYLQDPCRLGCVDD